MVFKIITNKRFNIRESFTLKQYLDKMPKDI